MRLVIWLLSLIIPFHILYATENQQTITKLTPVISYLFSDKSKKNTSISSIISYLLYDDKNLGRIMPLGDSITWDWYYGDNRPESQLHAYRSHLWWKLQAQHYKMDFVGSRHNGSNITPPYDGDNEAYTGWFASQIRDNIYHWLELNPADTILLHIGTNDSIKHSPDAAVYDVSRILDEIDRFEQNKNMKIKVILAKIIKLYRNGDNGYNWVISFNQKLGIMAQNRINQGDNLILVDMESGAGIDYHRDLIDGIHPTNCGYEKMANVWYTALTGEKTPPLEYCY